MKINIMLHIDKIKEKYHPQIDEFIIRLHPIKDYWKRLSEREQQILALGGAVLVLFMLVSMITMAVDYKNSLKESYQQLERFKIEAELISSSYKGMVNVTPNDFSSINSDRIKTDAEQILEVKDAEIILADNTLTVKDNNVKFEAVMLLIEQLRKSYGLFPSKLKITRLSKSGFVAFSATFPNVEQ